MNAESPLLRNATEADLPALLALGRDLYPGRGTDAAESWIREMIRRPDALVVIADDGAGICRVAQSYGFEPHARLDVLAVRPGNGLLALKIIRVMVWWAKQKGLRTSLSIGADTGVDFAPFAARLGGRKVETVRYEIPLEE